MPKDAPLQTDRGHVVLTELPDRTLLVEICEKVSPSGVALNVFAEHVGASNVVIEANANFRSIGGSRASATELEVFSDASDGRLHIAAVKNRGRIGK